MVSASLRKSVSDLSRRRARTLFTVATLALAVASISFLAVPTLIDRSMQDELHAGRLADATVSRHDGYPTARRGRESRLTRPTVRRRQGPSESLVRNAPRWPSPTTPGP